MTHNKSLTSQPCRLCLISNNHNNYIKLTIFCVFCRLRKGFHKITLLFSVLNTFRMELEHVVDINLFERKASFMDSSFLDVFSCESHEEYLEVVGKIGCLVPFLYE